MRTSPQTLVLLCQALSLLAVEMVNPFMPSYIHQLAGGSVQAMAFVSSLAIAAPMLGLILSAPLWGRLGDSLGYKPMLLRASIALVLSLLLTPLAETTNQLIVLRFFQGCFAGFIAAMQTYATQLVTINQRTKILGRLQTSKAIATSLGGLLGGGLILLLGLANIFFAASFIAYLSFLIIFFLLPQVSSQSSTHQHQKRQSPVSFHLSLITALIFLAQMAKFLPTATFSIYVEQLISANPMVNGLLYALPAIAIFFGSEIASKWFDKQRALANKTNNRAPLAHYFIIISLTGVLLTLLHGLTCNLIAIALIRFALGIVFASLLPALFAMLSHDKQPGLLIGIANSTAKLGNLTGLLLGGILAGHIALNQLFFIVAIVYSLMTMLCFIQCLKPHSTKEVFQ